MAQNAFLKNTSSSVLLWGTERAAGRPARGLQARVVVAWIKVVVVEVDRRGRFRTPFGGGGGEGQGGIQSDV